MALAFFGVEHEEANLRRVFRARGLGTSPGRVMIELPRLGFLALIYDGDLRILADNLAAGNPCIVHLWTEHLPHWNGKDPAIHAVVVTDLLVDKVLVNDPAFTHAGQPIPMGDFIQSWQTAGSLLMVIQPIIQDLR